MPIAKPGGGHDAGQLSPLLAQTFALSQLGDDDVSDGDSGETPIIKRTYALTGRYDADIAIDDTWEDDEAEYRVDSVNQSSGYKTSGIVVGFVKVGG